MRWCISIAAWMLLVVGIFITLPLFDLLVPRSPLYFAAYTGKGPSPLNMVLSVVVPLFLAGVLAGWQIHNPKAKGEHIISADLGLDEPAGPK